MAAQILSDAHIDALAHYAAYHKINIALPHKKAQQARQEWYHTTLFRLQNATRVNLMAKAGIVGELLCEQNFRCVYEQSRASTGDIPYKYTPLAFAISHACALKSARCYEFNASQCSTWHKSAARIIIVAIINLAIEELTAAEPFGLAEHHITRQPKVTP